MKTRSVSLILAIVGITTCSSMSIQRLSDVSLETFGANYPQSGTAGIVGFAKAAKLTGGIGGQVVIVRDLEAFRSAIAGDVKRIVVIGNQIRASWLTKVTLGRNKSILGSFGGQNVLHNIHIRATPQSGNVIFQNLVFSHDVNIKDNDDIQLYLNYGSGYWIDHCSWIGHGWNQNDNSLDKLLYVGDKADYVTVSNCYFANHKYGSIFGHPADDNNNAFNGYPRLTVCLNRYENILVRSPGLMRYGYIHVFNNYVNQFNLAFTVAQNANIISEKNYFGAGAERGGIVDDKGNGSKFSDLKSKPKAVAKHSRPASWTASSNYSYKLMTADEARTWAIAYAGAQSNQATFRFPA